MPNFKSIDVFIGNDPKQGTIPTLINCDRLLAIGTGDAPTRIEGTTRKITILQISEQGQFLSPMGYDDVCRIILDRLD